MTDSTQLTRPALLLILLFFILSGISGLIYQSVWSQYLGLILGHAAYAQSLVLSTFMGGMALGAWWASRLLSRISRLVHAYGALEGAIGLFGLAFHVVFLWVSAALFEHILPNLPASMNDFARYMTALLLILPQTILLGMTFPIMSAGLIRWQPLSAGRVLGGLYFFNSIGAAIGALLATFWFVPTAGLPGAMVIAGSLNLLIAAAVVLLRVPPKPSVETSATRVLTSDQQRLLRFVLVSAFITGAASFMYEIGWVRMLSLALGSSLHAFELMLAAFIGGLAFGGLYVRGKLDKLTDPLRWFGWIQVFMGLAALATLPLYDGVFEFVAWLLKALARTPDGYVLYNLATAAIAIVIMVPAAFLAGMTLPIMTYALLRNGIGERAIGWVYAANTVGAIAGVMLMVHVVLPALGLKLSMMLAATIDIALGVVVLRMLSERQSVREYAVAMGLLVGGVVLVHWSAAFSPERLNSGVYRTGRSTLKGDVLVHRDGKTATVALIGDPAETLVISTNGKPDASIRMAEGKDPTSDEPTMILAGLLALAHHPKPKLIANIGFGSGLTSHTLASNPLPERLVTIEIERAMVEVAKGFGARVERAYSDPRSEFVFDDARAFFARSRERFDVIVSEPSNPWVSGVAKLFSEEFYQIVPSFLADDGLLIQWVQAYEISDITLLTILRALDNNFADYIIYVSNHTDLLIVASPTRQVPAIHQHAFAGHTANVASRVGIESISDLRARQFIDRNWIRAMLAASPGPTNSDFFPLVAHRAPRDRFSGALATGIAGIANGPGSALQLLDREDDSFLSLTSTKGKGLTGAVQDRLDGIAILDTLSGKASGSKGRNGLSAEVLRAWASRCFGGVQAGELSRLALETFTASVRNTARSEYAPVWADQTWAECENRPESISKMLDVIASAAGREPELLLERSLAVINSIPEIPAGAMAHLYGLALVGADRVKSLDDVRQLKAAIDGGAVPLNATERFQLATVAAYVERRILDQQQSE